MSFGILPTDDLSVANATHTVSGTLDTAPSLQGGVAVNDGQLGVVTVDTANTSHALSSTVDSTASTMPGTSALPDVNTLTGTVTSASPVSVSLPDLNGVTSALPVNVDSLTGTVTGALPNTGLL